MRKRSFRRSIKWLFICLIAVTLLLGPGRSWVRGRPARSGRSQLSAARGKAARKRGIEKRRSKESRRATLSITIVDAVTTEALPNTPVAVGDDYLTSDANGAVKVQGIPAGDTTITARANKHVVYEQRHRLAGGDNTLTIALVAETKAVERDRLVYQRQAYLTIDDGPSSTCTAEVLDILKRQRVPATFFLVGFRAQRRPEMVRRIFLSNNDIGNHTFSHEYDELYRGSAKNLLASLAKNGRILKSIIGFEPKIMRPPGGITGNFRRGYQSSLNWAGYTTVLWNVSTGDGATRTTSPQMVANAKQYLDRLDAKEPAVILMHDVRSPIIKALPEIIAEVRRRGFQFSTVTEDLRESGVIMGR